MENGVIENSQLSQSSYLHANPSHAAQNGRLNLPGNGWCVGEKANNEFIGIDFKHPMVITAVATQGSSDDSAIAITTSYYLHYRKVGSTSFRAIQSSADGSLVR